MNFIYLIKELFHLENKLSYKEIIINKQKKEHLFENVNKFLYNDKLYER